MKKHLTLAVFCLLAGSQSAQAMKFRGYLNKLSDRKLYALCAGIQTSILSYKVWHHCTRSKNINEAEPVNKTTEKCIKNKLLELKFPQNLVDSLTIKEHESISGAAFPFTKSIILSKEVVNNLANSDKSINGSLGILAHEAEHIYRNVHLRLLLFPISSFCTAELISSLGQKLLKNTKHSAILFTLGEWARTLSLVLGHKALLWREEYKADQGAIRHIKDPNELLDYANYFRKLHLDIASALEEKFDLSKSTSSKLASVVFALFDHLHPTPLSRAKRFEKAAEVAEKRIKQQQNKK